jgi:hypothetical protein
VRLAESAVVEGFLPQLDPIIGYEPIENGWRGLTANGEVLLVQSASKPPVGEPVVVRRNGAAIGLRAVEDRQIDIAGYLEHFHRGVRLFQANEFNPALCAFDAAEALGRPTQRLMYNRALVLLSLGHWIEGFRLLELLEREPLFERPLAAQALAAGIKPWRGEPLVGKRLIILSSHGHGDLIQCLRYVRGVGSGFVALTVPPELVTLAGQCAPVITKFDADYFVPALHLLRWLRITPGIVRGEPYLAASPAAVERWRAALGEPKRKRVGLAWSVKHDHTDDYQRSIPIDQLVAAFGDDVELFSVQTQEQVGAEARGVRVHQFTDFADCAALMMNMDAIVSVDTAALHLAGAIGHPKVFGLLSHWHSWRWVARLYDNVTLCIQKAPGDWSSALAQIKLN